MSTEPVIVVVEPYGGSTRMHSPELPHIFWDDAAVTRGDAVVETLLIRGGRARNLERHLERFAQSAELFGLPPVAKDSWRKATAEAAAAFGAEGCCRWTLSRGRAATGNATAWIVVTPLGEQLLEERQRGVKVMLAPRGYSLPPKKARKKAPWLTPAAKSVNYAAAMAALRYARAHGFDDVIYVEDEHVLEGATSTVVVARGNKLRTPTGLDSILEGTTQAMLFAYAEAHGISVKAKDLTVDDLRAADSVWLLSAARTAVRVTHLGEEKLPKPKGGLNVAALVDEALEAN
ncbi:aminodeoxychorismate lyase [Corynebacterium sp. 13CS0277]|uniref:aminodeoxychorismate lyase n=1 Tax=Corynebacterium sp. 13CS0277 TaxID=2071994 RepID=UPI001E423550|nr:aminodeoxychorismate lyase [Corynebacterium sp. 13CS0277]